MSNIPEFLQNTIGKRVKVEPLDAEAKRRIDAWGGQVMNTYLPYDFKKERAKKTRLEAKIYKPY